MALQELEGLVEKLPQLRAEHARLGKLIEAIEAFSGEAADADAMPTEGGTVIRAKTPLAGGGTFTSDAFFGMNTHEAVKAFLAFKGKGNPQGPAAIAEGLVAGGQTQDPKKAYINVTSGLNRMGPNGSGEVVQVKRGKWGLSSWYGAGALKKKETPAKGAEAAPDDDTVLPIKKKAGA